MSANEIVLFESSDNEISLPVEVGNDTIWLTQAQMSELFATTKQNVSLHINNCFKEGELARGAVVKESLTTAADGKMYRVSFYNLDVVISVGYRVKSQRGVEFRQWATNVLRKHIIEGHTENERRLAQLGQVAQVMKRLGGDLDADQVLDVVSSFTKALDLLDDYDHQTLSRPAGTRDVYQLTYEECRAFIDGMKFGRESASLIVRWQR